MPLILVGPYAPSFNSIVELYRESESVLLLECKTSFEAIPLFRKYGGGVLLCNVNDSKSGVNALSLFKALKSNIRRGSVKVAITNALKASEFLKKLDECGIKDVLRPDINAKQLSFKVKNLISRVQPILKMLNKQGKEEDEDVIIKSKDQSKNKEKIEIAQRSSNKSASQVVKDKAKAKKNGFSEQDFSFKDPLTLESDCWISKGGNVRKVMGRWMINLIGPASQSAGRWLDATKEKNQRFWYWVPAQSENDPFIKEKGQWFFKGEKPEYRNDRWTFIGREAHLSFIDDGKELGSKIEWNAEERRLFIARDSTHAISKIPAIKASIEKRRLAGRYKLEDGESVDDSGSEKSKVAEFLGQELENLQSAKKVAESSGSNTASDAQKTATIEAWNQNENQYFMDEEEIQKKNLSSAENKENEASKGIELNYREKRSGVIESDHSTAKFKEEGKKAADTPDYIDKQAKPGTGAADYLDKKAELGAELSATQEGAAQGKELSATQAGPDLGSELAGRFKKEADQQPWNDHGQKSDVRQHSINNHLTGETIEVFKVPMLHFSAGGGKWEKVSQANSGKIWFVYLAAEIQSGLIKNVHDLERYFTFLGVHAPAPETDTTGEEFWVFRGQKPQEYSDFSKLPPHIQSFLNKKIAETVIDLSTSRKKENRNDSLSATQPGNELKNQEITLDLQSKNPKRYKDGAEIEEEDDEDNLATTNDTASADSEKAKPEIEALVDQLKGKFKQEKQKNNTEAADDPAFAEGISEALDAVLQDIQQKPPKSKKPQIEHSPETETNEEKTAAAPELIMAAQPPGPSISILAIGFLMAEIMGKIQSTHDYIFKRYCSYLSASCGGLPIEIWIAQVDDNEDVSWTCTGNSHLPKEHEGLPVTSQPKLMRDFIAPKSTSFIHFENVKVLVAPVPGASGVVCIFGDEAAEVSLDYASAVSNMLKGAVLGYLRDIKVQKDSGTQAA